MSRKVVAAFAVIYVVWGSNFIAIYFALNSFPPFILAGLRFFIAGLLMFVWCLLRGESVPKFKQWGMATVSGAFLLLGCHGGLTWAEQYIPSGLAAIMLATIPIWLVVLDAEGRRQIGKNYKIIAGLFLGLAGVGLVSIGQKAANSSSLSVTTSFPPAWLGPVVLLGAAFCWSIGSLLSKKMPFTPSLPLRIAIQMICGGTLLIIVSLLVGEWNDFSYGQIEPHALLAFIYLILFGTILGYTAYLWLLQIRPPAQVGTYAYVNPIVAIFLGWLLADEKLSLYSWLSLTTVLAAVLLINYQTQIKPKFDKL